MNDVFQGMAERKIMNLLTAILLLSSVSLFGQRIELSTDRTDYIRKDTIWVTIKIINENGQPLQTQVDVSAVYTKRGSYPSFAGSTGGKAGTRATQADVYSMIQQIKSFRLRDNRIIFSSVGPNTNGIQDGALIVINGSVQGQDASIIENLNPSDIERINVLTEFIDIQRYTGFNTTGVIEIYTKTGSYSSGLGIAGIEPSVGSHIPLTEARQTFADSMAYARSGKVILRSRGLRTDISGTADLDLFSGSRAGEIIIIAEHHNAAGIIERKTLMVIIR
jgi:hypothetical protein